jgi:hypothetical protein
MFKTGDSGCRGMSLECADPRAAAVFVIGDFGNSILAGISGFGFGISCGKGST